MVLEAQGFRAAGGSWGGRTGEYLPQASGGARSAGLSRGGVGRHLRGEFPPLPHWGSSSRRLQRRHVDHVEN
eukprot:7391898-Prymnesium_polylepis.2